MNDEQVARHLAKMAMIWPNADVDEASMSIWVRNLGKMREAERADRALDQLGDSTPFWPHWSEFMKVYRELLSAESRKWNSATPAGDKRCARCRDTGWLEVEGQNGAVHPCPMCRVEQHDRWTSGEMTGRSDLDEWRSA